MTIMSIQSDEERIHVREILSEAVAGREMVIQQGDEPLAVVVPHEMWKAIKISEAIEDAKQILAKIKNGESRWIPSDEVMAAVAAKRKKRLAQENLQNVDA